ncbi:MAG: hypothetical protein M0Z42_14310 [Actinomycetota bacterium]|jgi:hypothetical protein|nr:hypothetical protein [Actinomycetota bacterium]
MHERWTVRWFRKRAVAYHLLLAVIAPGCSIAADWQIHRAIGGNLLSWLYAVEWPVFAVLAVVGWWQLIHEDPARVEARKVERARRAATHGPFVPPPPDAATGFVHPLQAASHPELVGGSRLPAVVDGDAGEEVSVHQLSEYNAYLARLAAGRTRKSWRNPHGVPTRP